MTLVSDRWAVGAAYEAYMGRWSRPLAQVFIEWLAADPHRHWLDVGCGTGQLTAAICELAKPRSVIACDSSGPFLEAASSTLPDKRVAFELGDAEHLPRREGGFDVVVSGLVLNFVPHLLRAVTHMRRRLGASGVVAGYVWDYAEGPEFSRRFWDAAVALDPAALVSAESTRFAACDAAGLEAAFVGAGLRGVEIERLSITTAFANFDDYWGPFLGRTGAAPSYVATLDATQRERLRERLRELLAPEPGSPIRLEASAWAVRGSGAGDA